MKNKNLIIFAAAFVAILVVGLLLGSGITSEQKRIEEKKFFESVLPGIKTTEITEAQGVTYLTKDDTKIVKSYVAKNGSETVGMIYIGETKGWKVGLQVAFGINTKTNKIVGMEFVANDETPMYFEALGNTNFKQQFASKDLNEYLLKVELVSGATPGGGNGTIAPSTSGGVQKVMLLVREQYAKDTAFEMPVGIVFVSKTWNFEDTDQFIYTLSLAGEEMEVIVDRDHKIISIADESQKDAAQAIINEHKFVSYIESVSVDGDTTTLVIHAKTYSSTFATTTVVIKNGVVESVDLVYSSAQTYEDEHNYDYLDGKDAGKDYSGAPDQMKNDTTIEAITGATRTWEGLRDTQLILRGFLEAQK